VREGTNGITADDVKALSHREKDAILQQLFEIKKALKSDNITRREKSELNHEWLKMVKLLHEKPSVSD
ncbi:MAG: hypothetical protein ACRDBI_07500, partial [Shewanella sp.]